MDHNDHINLLRPANLKQGGVFADFGAGNGAFTLALRELVGINAEIFAIDKDKKALEELREEFLARTNSIDHLTLVPVDFSRSSFDLPLKLDGIVMANSLHFFKDKEKILRHVRKFLKPNGALLIVEYNVDSGNIWVPYPLTFETWQVHAPRAGFSVPRLLAKVPSRFLKEFYSAVAYRV
jgi:ubiquinone/menaquinone biosynthesis C-methylase UbiE